MTNKKRTAEAVRFVFVYSLRLYQPLMAACAAARRAMGTRKGLQET